MSLSPVAQGSPLVLGIDFGGTKIAVAVADLAGHRLATRTIDARGDDGARAVFDRGLRTARELLAEVRAAPPPTDGKAHDRHANANANDPHANDAHDNDAHDNDNNPLAAVGVSTFGIPGEDGVALSPAIEGWHAIAMGRELRAAFADTGAVVTMTTDVKAAALAEARWGALRDADPAIYLNLGTGLAVAIVTEGKVLTGANGASGEIGYNLRQISDTGKALADRVPLEDAVSGRAIARLAGRPAREVFETDTSDVTDFTAELAYHLVNLTIAIDPVRIAVGGGMTRSWDRIAPALDAALSAGVPYPPELVLAGFPYDAPLIGALALAIDQIGVTGQKTLDHTPIKPENVLSDKKVNQLPGRE